MGQPTVIEVSVDVPSNIRRHNPNTRVIAQMIREFLQHCGVTGGTFRGTIPDHHASQAEASVRFYRVDRGGILVKVKPADVKFTWTVALKGSRAFSAEEIAQFERCRCTSAELKHRGVGQHHDPNPLERLVAGMDGAVIAAALLVPSGFVTAGDKPGDFRILGAFLLANLDDHDLAENLIHTLAEAGVVTSIGTNANGPSSRVWNYNHTVWLALYDELLRQGKTSPKDVRLDTPVVHAAPPPTTDPIAEAISVLEGEIAGQEQEAARLRREADEAEAEIGRNDAAVREAETALERLRQETSTNNGRLHVKRDRNREQASAIDGALTGLRARRQNLDEIRGIKQHLDEIDLRNAGKPLSAIAPGDLQLVAQLRGRLDQIQA